MIILSASNAVRRHSSESCWETIRCRKTNVRRLIQENDYPVGRLLRQKTNTGNRLSCRKTTASEDLIPDNKSWECWNIRKYNRCDHTMVVRKSIQDAGKEWNQITMESNRRSREQRRSIITKGKSRRSTKSRKYCNADGTSKS